MNKFTKKVARFISRKFLAEEMKVIKEELHNEEIYKVRDELEYYKSVIKKLQEDKNKLSSLKFKEQIDIKTKHLNLDKNDDIELDNPYADYL